jgi:hypothetical protein
MILDVDDLNQARDFEDSQFVLLRNRLKSVEVRKAKRIVAEMGLCGPGDQGEIGKMIKQMRLEMFEQLLTGRIRLRRELARSFPSLASASELKSLLQQLDRMIDFFVEAGSREASLGPQGTTAAQVARYNGECFKQLARLELDVLEEEFALLSAKTAHGPAAKSVRRRVRYLEIDRALQEIGASRPKNHREVFRALDGRTSVPYAEPFLGAKGWLAGFQANPRAAQAWLSKSWSRLHLPPFRRGPK